MQGHRLKWQEAKRLKDALRYRLEDVVERATEFKDCLGLRIKECEVLHVDDYRAAKGRGAKFERLQERYGVMLKAVKRRELFELPGEGEGEVYEKGDRYLATALAETSWSRMEVEEALDELKAFREETSIEYATVAKLRLAERPVVKTLLGNVIRDMVGGPDEGIWGQLGSACCIS